MTRAEIQSELRKHADEKYRKFSSGLLPDVENVLGVRLPVLRKLARELAKTDWQENMSELSDDSFEEIMLQGMMIGCVKCSFDERLELIRRFILKIDNWSVCDSFCTGLKFAKKNQEEFFRFLKPYISSDKEYDQRFVAVILLNYYIDEEWLSRTVKALQEIQAREYYAKMAVAWAMAECYLHFPDEVMPILKKNKLDPEIQQKTLQKIIESRIITPETREEIRAMKKACRKI
jgi:3-methyladenine DNA glycosylase AlkD